ncbi:MAG TPA: hypothetical protein IAC94_00215 [Candidatus Coprenecus avistercoris]|uniref:HTH luxR-type domain-containing protein n=1 Tax=Candidatus Coprenecus avistercoris TaxID=2840730 RepID=A0A9D1DZ80_9BACT|nr:hypothetical protein [Candidatus Coprenecus avistercoris]
MKIRIDIFRLAVAVLAAAVIIYGLSCSSGNGKATPLLETADSLMASDPQAARQVLSSVADGKDIRMSRAERAYYLLLVAEADYLCGEPMIRDTAVHGAVEFFRSGAQKRLCARALLMRAAVRQEMADTLAGLGSWWNALPASERAGDGESMRLLRSVVRSMYTLMPDCGAEQYAAALDSLERRTGVEEAAEVYLSLARGLFSYAAGQAADDIALGMRLAREEGDGRVLTLGEELLGKQSVLMGGTYVGNRADVEALRLAGLILENESLRLQSAEARLQVMALVLVLAAVLAVVLAGAGILWLRVRRLRLENCALKASIETFEVSPESEGAEAGEGIQSVLRDMVALIGEMNEACGRDGDGSTSTVDIRKMLDRYFPEEEVHDRIRRICDLLYPGVLSEIEREHPSLTRNDLLLIALMACGFPTGAICAVRRLNVHSLNVQKTRTARKIAPGLRLSDFVAQNFPRK